MSQDKVCIIGAGASGLVTAKTLHQRGIPFDCFEMGSDIGGLWRYENDNGRSSAYASLHVNTSRGRMDFADFPMLQNLPDFPHHTQVLAYFEDYIAHFGFRDTITFDTIVTHISPLEDWTYEVTRSYRKTGETVTERYVAVIVANGHHWHPNWPAFPGDFEGIVMHTHDYRTPDLFKEKRVLVVGVGNSGCDIVCEAARTAQQTFLSTRRGAHVMPKYLLGRPLDSFVTPATSRLPYWMQDLTASALLWLSRGRQSRHGFPTPDYPFGAAHPTISNDLLELVGEGYISVKPNVARLDGHKIHFEDGTDEEIDVLIYATGYTMRFPFFDKDFLDPEENKLPLYLQVVPPQIPNLYFIGLIQPVGALMPLAEVQAAWVADLLEGRVGLPSSAEMLAAIERHEAKARKRYVASKRHSTEVQFYPYLRVIEQERKAVNDASIPRRAVTKKRLC